MPSCVFMPHGLRRGRMSRVKLFCTTIKMNRSGTTTLLPGAYHLHLASHGSQLTKYHLEAGIAYWHTIKADTKEKWENILQLYNRLLQVAYSPVAALNRTYALSKARNKETAIEEAEKLKLTGNHFILYCSRIAFRQRQGNSKNILNRR